MSTRLPSLRLVRAFLQNFQGKTSRGLVGLRCILSVDFGRRRNPTSPMYHVFGCNSISYKPCSNLFFASDSLADDGYCGSIRDEIGYKLTRKITFISRTIRRSRIGRKLYLLIAPRQRAREEIWSCHTVRLLVGITMTPNMFLSGQFRFLSLVDNIFHAFHPEPACTECSV